MTPELVGLFGEASQLVIGSVFVYSALLKGLAYRDFIHGVHSYRLLPVRLVTPAAWLILVCELSIGVAHLASLWLSEAAVVGIALLTTFAIAVAVNLRRGRRIPCHCRPGRTELIGAPTLIRIGAMLSLEMLVVHAALRGSAHPLFAHSWLEGIHIGAVGFSLFVFIQWLVRAPDVFDVWSRVLQGFRRNRPVRFKK